jgi:hypothetical protein
MSRLTLALAAATALGSIAAGIALAGPERVKYPEKFTQDFVMFNTIDRPDLKAVRLVFINKAADAAAKPGQPLPDGSILIVEQRKAKLDDKGEPMRDAAGRLIPTDEVMTILAMEKRKGWGEAYPVHKRNGDWEYNVFKPDRTANMAVKMDGCFGCHLNRADRDFTFTYFKNRQDRGN